VISEWLAGGVSVLVLLLMGQGWRFAPVVGAMGQVFWFWFIWKRRQWGLLPPAIAYTVVHLFNSWIWLQ
jgi:hypothetical protein